MTESKVITKIHIDLEIVLPLMNRQADLTVSTLKLLPIIKLLSCGYVRLENFIQDISKNLSEVLKICPPSKQKND